MGNAWEWLKANRVAVAGAVNALTVGANTYFAASGVPTPPWFMAVGATLAALGLPVLVQSGASNTLRMMRRNKRTPL